MRKKSSTRVIILLLVIISILLFNTFSLKKDRDSGQAPLTQSELSKQPVRNKIDRNTQDVSINQLTKESIVVPYVRRNGKLPDYYITKNNARNKGWKASEQNLCDVLPGHAIGGDAFANRERRLPIKKGRKYYEADLNYNCDERNAHRLIYSNDGLIYVTYDHYNTFEKR
ncbi:MAG: ribonuclease domain-containing protein [Paludibacteraceae bacterium]